MKRGLAMLCAVSIGISALSACASKSDNADFSESNTEAPVNYEPDDLSVLYDYVDFVVDVESGRDIRVLQLTDVQTISADQKRYPNRVTSSSAANTVEGYKKYIGQVIDRYDPDLIIMTGDNVYGEFDDSGERLVELIEYMDSFKIPWAPILGNHDAESFMGVDWQCEQYEKSEYCLFKQRDLTGNGNYSVALTQDGRLMRVFYMLDSNGCSNASKISLANGHTKREVGFGSDQIDWYTRGINAIMQKYPNVKFSMAFHIQLNIFSRAFKQYGYPLDLPIDLNKIDEAKEKGDFGYIGSALKTPWDTGNTVWNGIKKLGVDSVFVGHEHTNSASVLFQGVRLTYGQKSSTFDRYSSDSNGPVMGGTYFNISNKDGSINDAGLCLYDYEIGYDHPEAPDDGAMKYEDIPDDATVTVLDLDGTSIDTSVYTDKISVNAAKDVSDLESSPEGSDGKIFGSASSGLSSLGIKLCKEINADKLRGVFVKMYVADYKVTAGKTPLIRIYNDKENSALNEVTFSYLGGKNDEWVYINILDLLKNSDGIIENGRMNPFTLVYRFYGDNVGIVYFDSVTLVSEGDPYTFDASSSEQSVTVMRGAKCTRYSLNDLVSIPENDGKGSFYSINEESYTVNFSFVPGDSSAGFSVCGYVDAMNKDSGISVTFKNDAIKIDNCTVAYTFENGELYDIEVGFANLYDGNTICVFIKINGRLQAWELVEAFGLTRGNLFTYSN